MILKTYPKGRSAMIMQSILPGSRRGRDVGQTPADETCTPNISRQERLKRLAGGAIAFVISFVILVTLMTTDTSRWWRLALFPLFMGATSGFFQWRDKT